MALKIGPPRSIDIVVPLYNEAESCQRFHEELSRTLAGISYSPRIIYVNDGSTDGTASVLNEIRRRDSFVIVVELSRNFGHQAALTAGLDTADADVVIMMDGDGQHPPALIGQMLQLYEAGAEIVQTLRVDPPKSLSPVKRFTSKLFYKLLNQFGELDIGSGAADFRLISREVLQTLRSLREYHRFLRGLIPWLGFRSTFLPFEPPARFAGATKYSFRKMMRLAQEGLFSFSLFPLRLGLLLGLLMLLLGFGELIYIAIFFLTGRARELAPGWSSLVVLLTVSSGTTMILLGFIGIYVGMIFQQVKGRPIYIMARRASTIGIESTSTAQDHAPQA